MQFSFITNNSFINNFILSSELTLSTKSSPHKMMWTKSLIKSMCILFLFSRAVLAATDLVHRHHRRLLEHYGDVPNFSNLSNVPNIPNVPNFFNVPNVPSVPNVPEIPSVPEVPSVPEEHHHYIFDFFKSFGSNIAWIFKSLGNDISYSFNRFVIHDIFKRFGIVSYITIFVFLVIVTLLFVFLRLCRFKKDESSSQPRQRQRE